MMDTKWSGCSRVAEGAGEGGWGATGANGEMVRDNAGV